MGVVGGTVEGVTVFAGAAVAVPAIATADGVDAGGEGSRVCDRTGRGDLDGDTELGDADPGAGTGLPAVVGGSEPADALSVEVA